MKRFGYNHTPGVFVDEQGDLAFLGEDGDEVVLKSTYYSFRWDDISCEDIEVPSLDGYYWLASKSVEGNDSCAFFDVYYVWWDNGMYRDLLFTSNDQLRGYSCGVRAVVCI